ncbi:MAG: glycogen/starch/alpha-glucan phosphorylase [Gammaproteobacteria bacterium]
MAVLNPRGGGAYTDTDSGVRTGLSVADIKRDFRDNLFFIMARFPDVASTNDLYQALAYTVRDRLLERWVRSAQKFRDTAARTVCYFSAEFLLGPQLGANILNLGLQQEVDQAMRELGINLEELLDHEVEPGLGNGGLGRLAACYMESLATLQIPTIGYGIRYEFGIFTQEIRGGWQVEKSDRWLSHGNPWEIRRPTITFDIGFGGRTESWTDDRGRYRVRWIPEREVRGVAYDIPIIGYQVKSANMIRLWSAEAVESFDFAAFNTGDYYGAVDEKIASEVISKVLYPNDEPAGGKELRLAQQYFLVSCALRDMIRIHLQVPGRRLEDIELKYAVQLNDTHPALAIAEFMRLLIDDHLMDWEPAWDLTTRIFAYTNHTLLPEALETWPLALLGKVLPRHLDIIHEINRRFLDEARLHFPGEIERIARLSLIDEQGERHVRMANLACVGSHAINGVAALHTDLLRTNVLADFHALWPRKFSNKTNGISPRRFVVLDNPELTDLISTHIGSSWVIHMDELRKLETWADDGEFRHTWRQVKRRNKERLAARVATVSGVAIDPEWLFDVQAKRIHAYKRQHLNVLNIVTQYLRLKHNPGLVTSPRVYLFGGKAAPGYFMAKLIIRLITAVADVVNRDTDVNEHMKVAFLPNFSVKEARFIYPAADLSEQISVAGKEASGTGNMKFSMNGALTIGTLDGANIEIRDEVGAENFFLFGLDVDGVRTLWADGYRPREVYENNPELRAAIDLIASGHFSGGDQGLFQPLIDELLYNDEFLVMADYAAYVACQDEVTAARADLEHWTRMSILNVARMGKFSSDRAIREYCEEIWRVTPVVI